VGACSGNLRTEQKAEKEGKHIVGIGFLKAEKLCLLRLGFQSH